MKNILIEQRNDMEALQLIYQVNTSGSISDHICFLAQQLVEKSLKVK
jgi:NADPH-dependent glutamate synthase beta subunit-like oxidoreductase